MPSNKCKTLLALGVLRASWGERWLETKDEEEFNVYED